jgi:hypothetical protein
VLGPIRTLISIVFVASLVYCSFTVDLGGKTFAEHADAIGETPPAKALVDGARDTINPALEATKERILGEYIEAPTGDDARALAGVRPDSTQDPDLGASDALSRANGLAVERPLPGRRP